jgi:hypothetical protein
MGFLLRAMVQLEEMVPGPAMCVWFARLLHSYFLLLPVERQITMLLTPLKDVFAPLCFVNSAHCLESGLKSMLRDQCTSRFSINQNGLSPSSPSVDGSACMTGRAEQLLLPGITERRVETLAAAEVGDLDDRPHPIRDNSQLVRGAPLPSLSVRAQGRSSRFSSSYSWKRLFTHQADAPF